MLLQTQIQLNKQKEKMLKPKEQKKQSSISTQIHKMKLAFESLNLLQILLQAKIFFLILFKFKRKDLAHKERFCSNSTKINERFPA